jgi:hypothetical protein
MYEEERQRILGHVARLADNFWKARNTQMEEDRSLYYLEEPPKRAGFEQVVLNEPKVLWDTATALLSSQFPRLRLPISIDFTPEQKEKMNKAERLLIGIFRELDERQLRRGQHSWLREIAFWACSGWIAGFPLVTERNGVVEFSCDLYDPMTVYPEWGSSGLVRLVRKYDTTVAHARTMIEENNWRLALRGDDGDTVTVINFWELVREGKDYVPYNCVIIHDEFAKPPTREDFPHIPIIVIPVGGAPIRAYGKDTRWTKRVGESIIATNRGMYAQLNRWVSLMMQIVAETAYPPIIDYTETGRTTLKKQDMGSGVIIPKRINEKLEAFKMAATPVEVNTLMSLLGAHAQRGGLPYMTYGGVPFELSGFAISQLLAAIRYKVGPYITAMESAISMISREFLRQYKAGGFSKIKLTTLNPDKPQKGQFYMEEFKPSDVPDVTYVEVTVPITTPTDRVQQLLMARQALAPPQLLSRETLWEDFLDVQDSDLEYQRIIGDQVNELPIMKMIAVLEELKQRVIDARNEGNIPVAEALNRYIMMIEMQLGMRQGIPTTPGAPGVPPEMSPPEMGVMGPSPDVLRAGQGMGPPGLRRRPQTPEERAERQQGRGPIYGPGGEFLF